MTCLGKFLITRKNQSCHNQRLGFLTAIRKTTLKKQDI
jgi:hypothetical protein